MKLPKFELSTAIRVYYENTELGSSEISELFNNKISNSTIWKLKNIAIKLAAEKDVPSFGAYSVNTVVAYEAWGLDIKDLEHRYQRLEKLKLLKEVENYEQR